MISTWYSGTVDEGSCGHFETLNLVELPPVLRARIHILICIYTTCTHTFVFPSTMLLSKVLVTYVIYRVHGSTGRQGWAAPSAFGRANF